MKRETHKDPTLDFLSKEIDKIKEELTKVNQKIKKCKETKNTVYGEISSLKLDRNDAKMEADMLFGYARDCSREYKDVADEYRYNAKKYMEQVEDLKEQIDSSYDQFDGIKEQLEKLEEERKKLGEKLHTLIEQHKERVQQLKEQNALNWREKPCAVCGEMLKYNVKWKNIPNICPKCKEKSILKKDQQRSDSEL